MTKQYAGNDISVVSVNNGNANIPLKEYAKKIADRELSRIISKGCIKYD